MSKNLPAHPLQGLLEKAQRTIPATTGRVAAQQARIDRRQGATVILADISASMGSSAWGDQRKIDVLREAVAGARQQRDARLFAFSGSVREVTTIPEPENNTNLAGALEHVLPLDPGAVLVISDGQPDNAERALAVAARFRGAIDVLYVGPESDHAAIAFMRRLAGAAGGDVQMHDMGKIGSARQLQTRISGLLR